MQFKQIRIPYAGRERYPSNGNGKAIANSLIKEYFGGSVYGGGGDGSYGGDENRGGNSTAFYAFLTKNSTTFSGLELASTSLTETIVVHGYRNMEEAQTFIGDITESADTGNYGISGITDSGMTVSVSDNGTSATTIIITIDSSISSDSGTLTIPVNVNINDNTIDPYHYVWNEKQNKTRAVNLSWSWTVDRGGSSSYVLDLSNETAGVNCDSAGTIYSASTAALTCTASTHLGTDLVQGVTYSISTLPRFNAHGVSIGQSNGVLSWESSFGFDGPTLPIDVIATLSGSVIATKTMTITKNYPGADGSPAVTRWIVTSVSEVKYNPNTSASTPSSVTAYVMMQVGGNEPYRDSATTIYYGYSTSTPTQPYPSTGATVYPDEGYISFALKNTAGVYYEIETVPILWEGINGGDGRDGENGRDGNDGASGKSAWYLTLNNDNASVNCDASGNILTNSIKPTCQAKLYYGDARQSDAAYIVDYGGASGVTTATSNGILTITCGSNLKFNDPTVNITVSGYGGSVAELRDVKVMTITKSYAGEDGSDGVSYWLEPSYTEVIYDPNSKTCNPTSITVNAYKQVGEQAATTASDCTIRYQFQYRSTNSFTSESEYSSSISMTQSRCETYRRLRVLLYKGNSQVDMEDIDIIKDGLDGNDGAQGRKGAAIRGPYDWYAYSGATREWCNGESSSTVTNSDMWIDVVLKDDTYYYCVQSYRGNLVSYINNTNYWSAGTNFDFVAANLIMANNAKIKFLSGNEIYLMSGNTVTAGLAGGSGITFWSGAEDPDQGLFKVDAGGGMSATTGLIGGWEYDEDGLHWDYFDDFETYQNAWLNSGSMGVSFKTAGDKGEYSAGVGGIHYTTEHFNTTGLEIGGAGKPDVMFLDDGTFYCDMTIKSSSAGTRDAVAFDDNIVATGKVKVEEYNTAVSSPYASNIKIAFVTTGSSASVSTAITTHTYFRAYKTGSTTGGVNTYEYGDWYFNGDMKIGEYNQNGGDSLYMIVGTTGMVNDEINLIQWYDGMNEYHEMWRSGGASNDYVVDVIQSGDTFYCCSSSYIGWLNWETKKTTNWTTGSWETIMSGRFYEGSSIKGTPSSNMYGIPYRWVGMWLGSSSSSGSKYSYGYVPTGIYCKSGLIKRRGDTIYIEV